MSTIALDAMGGDHAPVPEVAGALAAVRKSDVNVVLVGDRTRLELELERIGGAGHDRLRIEHASEVVTMHDNPGQAFRKKTDSSLRVACNLVKAADADAVVSAGNSGAVLSHALFLFKRIDGVERPGIVTVFPTPHGEVVLCDMGANVSVKPAMLAQFGVLGACYDRVLHRRRRPRVGLLSNGSEESKGTDLTRAAHTLLRSAADNPDAEFDYVGYVEGGDVFGNVCDVVATDGWTGNVVLKISEGVASAVFRMVKDQLMASTRGRLAGALAKPMMMELRNALSSSDAGGGVLLGVRELVMICHGSSDSVAIENAVLASNRFVGKGLVQKIGSTLARHQRVWERGKAEPEGGGV